jgi:hypothetical protein
MAASTKPKIIYFDFQGAPRSMSPASPPPRPVPPSGGGAAGRRRRSRQAAGRRPQAAGRRPQVAAPAHSSALPPTAHAVSFPHLQAARRSSAWRWRLLAWSLISRRCTARPTSGAPPRRTSTATTLARCPGKWAYTASGCHWSAPSTSLSAGRHGRGQAIRCSGSSAPCCLPCPPALLHRAAPAQLPGLAAGTLTMRWTCARARPSCATSAARMACTAPAGRSRRGWTRWGGGRGRCPLSASWACTSGCPTQQLWNAIKATFLCR